MIFFSPVFLLHPACFISAHTKSTTPTIKLITTMCNKHHYYPLEVLF